ncbi:MAG: TVP38/TMEM64 family protein [Syntrophobacterales bacterium]|nr:TVP38/TMEM64 family protein [Syntrophobacterales bacterium]
MPITENRTIRVKLMAALGLAILFGGIYWFLFRSGFLETVCDCAKLHGQVLQWGLLGPLAVIGLMTMAVVVSPIPSAPIALASGLAYGHFWGTIYIVIGAEAGAVIAFFIARSLGYEAMKKRFGNRLSVGLLGSQNAMTGLVMALRLIPFASFDIVSYAAGLTPLKPWRFALATLVGLIPVSFALAHFGGELAGIDFNRITLIALALGAVTLIPILAIYIRRRKGSPDRSKVLPPG